MLRHVLGWMLIGSVFLIFSPTEEGIPTVGFAAPAAPKKSADAPAQGEAEAKVARVEGFRSARFGMTEGQVLEAIRADFGIAKDAVARDVNTLERTTHVTITVPDLLPGSGPAQVAYIFGYKTKKLIQVNILWGKPINPHPDASALTTAASLLRNYFIQQGFRNEKTVVNARLDDGTLIVFRGTDEKGRMLLLLLNAPPDGTDQEAQEAQKAQAPKAPAGDPALQLSYIENVNAPDIFKIKEGQF